jgi:hypothetical protein
MRSIAWLAAPLAAVAGCEVLVGIHDKTEATDPSVPCAQQPPFLFCDDFDTEVDAGDTWSWDMQQGGSTIAIDSTDYKTPPHSARIVAPAASPDAQLGQPVGHLSTGFRLAFDLRVDVTDLTPIPEVGIAQVLTGNNLLVNYVLGPGSTCSIQVFDSVTNESLLAPTVQLPPLQTWTRIVIVYDAEQGLTVIEDGATLLPTTSAVARGAPGDTTIILGAVYVTPPGSVPLTLEIDDVVMRGQ